MSRECACDAGCRAHERLTGRARNWWRFPCWSSSTACVGAMIDRTEFAIAVVVLLVLLFVLERQVALRRRRRPLLGACS